MVQIWTGNYAIIVLISIFLLLSLLSWIDMLSYSYSTLQIDTN